MSRGQKPVAATSVGCRNFRLIGKDRKVIRDRVLLGYIVTNLQMLRCILKEVLGVLKLV